MRTIVLYKFNRSDSGITVSPIKPDIDNYVRMIRIIADNGKLLTKDNIDFCYCVDVDNANDWYEADSFKYQDIKHL